MKKRLIILILCLCLVLGGCGVVDFSGYFQQLAGYLGAPALTSFEDMAYTRPDMAEFQRVLEESLEQADSEKNLNRLVDTIYEFYAVYDSFYTNYALADIHYCLDVTDVYWQAEYDYCLQQVTAVNAALDLFYRALAKSPLRAQLESDEYFGADFFSAFEADTLYDDTFQALLTQEAQLQSQYYALMAQAPVDASGMLADDQLQGLQELYVQMIGLRQEIAAYAGYASYPDFAYAFYFGRDYTPLQAQSYLDSIRQALSSLYADIYATGLWSLPLESCSQKQTLDYVKNMAGAMGGLVQEAFEAMQAGGLYDISYSANKFSNSFEIFLNDYYTPYIFLSPTNTVYDQLSFAHEFGHFCNDYASFGSMAGIDVAEVFSQGMEYLSLCYVQDASLTQLKMGDCLQVYVEQAAYASFEHQVYDLKEEALTVSNVQAVFQDTLEQFRLADIGYLSSDYVYIPHFFISPMYVISYVVSNDVALQLYLMEQTEAGSGLACLEGSLTTAQTGIQGFVAEAGLRSPFADDWHKEVYATLKKAILG